MSIINAYDNKSEAIINPDTINKPIKDFPETVVVTFSRRSIGVLLSLFETEIIGSLYCTFTEVPIYKVIYNGKPLAIYNSLIGGAGAASFMEETIAKGGKRFLYYGSCGSMDNKISAGHLIVPTAAYRDEGVSYHYQPASDYIDIPTANKTASLLSELSIPHIKAKTWTTDAFFRETRNNFAARKSEGCMAVEMECASLAAVGAFRNVGFYQFLYAEDSLAGVEWDPRIMGTVTTGELEKYLRIALETAVRL